MIRMESHHSDTSLNFSERESPAWVKLSLWNSNYNSAGGLNLGENGSETDFASAIGDKEVAAKAVAFVVNSSRKGIVPLCADVANLLRAKRSLEDRMLHLSKENVALRLINDERESLLGSTVGRFKQSDTTDSHQLENQSWRSSYRSASPVSQNANTERISSTADVIEDTLHTTLQSSKHLYNTKATINSNSTIIPEHSFLPVTPARKASPRVDNEVIIHPIPSSESDDVLPNNHNSNGNITLAEVHVHSEPSTPRDSQTRDKVSERQRRTPSISSSEHGSSRSLELNMAEEKQSKLSSMSRQLSKSILANNKLTEELNAARATIEKLQREVRDFRVFCKNSNHDGAHTSIVNSQILQRQASSPDILPTQQKLISEREISAQLSLSSCQLCAEVQKNSAVNGTVTESQFKHDAITLITSDNMLVSLNDSVLTKNNQCGTVRFIGHLDGFSPTCLFVGLQLADRVAGGIDGTFNGKKYYSCPKGYGLFIQAHDIVNVLSKKQASVLHKTKRTPASNTAESSGSSFNSSSTGRVRRFRKATATIRHTHSQKRISIPGNSELRQSNSSNDVNNQSSSSVTNATIMPSTSYVSHYRTNSLEAELPEGYV